MPQISPTGNISENLISSSGSGPDFNLSVGVNPFTQQAGVSPTLIIGDSQEAAIGGQVGSTGGGIAGAAFGGPIGASVGTFVGSAVGSATGSIFGDVAGDSKAAEQHKQRDSVINAYKDDGLWGEDYAFQFPDGSTYRFDVAGGEGRHILSDPSRAAESDRRQLFNYDTDYTNDLDYINSMAGISLSRLTAGGTNTAVDQIGSMMGNAFLGNVGHNKPLTQETFNATMANARAMYAQRGIKSKADMLSLANQMYAEHRVDDFGYNVLNQTATLVFDNNFGTAQQLMGGRWKGIETAGKTPANASATIGEGNRPGRIYSPILSSEEAQLSVSRLLDIQRANAPRKRSSTAATIAQGAGAVSAALGAYRAIDRATEGGLSEEIKGGLGSIFEFLNLDNPFAPDIPEIVNGAPPATPDVVGASSTVDTVGGLGDIISEGVSDVTDFIGGLF